jgi:hypothetical protein
MISSCLQIVSFRAEQADSFFRVRSSNASACAVEESRFAFILMLYAQQTFCLRFGAALRLAPC